MIFELLNKKVEYNNEPASVQKIMDSLDEFANSPDYVLNSIIINNIEIYEDYYNCLMKNIDEVQTVEVILLSSEEYIGYIFATINEYVNGALSEIRKLADDFYKGASDDVWHSFQQFLEGMEWIVSVSDVAAEKKSDCDLNLYFKIINDLKEKLLELGEAITASDLVLAADLINYEIIDVLENLIEAVNSVKK